MHAIYIPSTLCLNIQTQKASLYPSVSLSLFFISSQLTVKYRGVADAPCKQAGATHLISLNYAPPMDEGTIKKGGRGGRGQREGRGTTVHKRGRNNNMTDCISSL